MNTDFYWDKEKTKPLMTRRKECNDSLVYVLDLENLIKFFQTEPERVVYDEYGVPWTIKSLRLEVERGLVRLNEEYFEKWKNVIEKRGVGEVGSDGR